MKSSASEPGLTIKKKLKGRSLKRGWKPKIQGTGGRRFGLLSNCSFLVVRRGINKGWWGTQEPSLVRSAPGNLGD